MVVRRALLALLAMIQQLNLQTQAGQQIQRIGVSLAPEGGGVGSIDLTLTQEILMDAADLTKSRTEVSVLAWLGAENPAGIFMQNQSGIGVGDVSQSLATGGEAPIVAAAAMAGFDFTFASDSHFLGLGVSCGTVQDLFATGVSATRALAQGTLTSAESR